MLTQSTPNPEIQSRPPLKGWQLGAAFGIFLLVYVIGFALGGEVRQIMVAGLQTLPFVALALLTYLGLDYGWAKILSVLTLVGLLGVTALFALGLGIIALQSNPTPTPGSGLEFVAGGPFKLLLLLAGSGVAVLLGALPLIPGVRRALSQVLPFNPESFLHTIALVAVVTLTLISFLPLIVLGEPPLLAMVERITAAGQDVTGGRGDAGMLRDLLYGLVWLIPSAILAVGYGIRRTLPEALERLGLVRPSLRQVLTGLGIAVLLVVLVQVLSLGINWLWGELGWPLTNDEAFGELLGFAMSAVGAVVVGVTAGLGEELAVRGVLQPRLGILLSNLFFTSLHAFQYNWDALLVVFLVGTVCGLVRRRTNTTTAAIVHGTYNFLLIMLSVLTIPGLSQ